MAKRGNPNPTGSKPDKLIRDTLNLVLKEEAANADGVQTKKLRLVCEKLVDKAIAGDIAAIKEINDRMDGRATETLVGDPDRPLAFTEIRRTIVRPTR